MAGGGSLSSSSRHFSFFPGSSAQQMCSAVLLNLPLLALGSALFPPGYLNSSLCSALQSPLSQARWMGLRPLLPFSALADAPARRSSS